MTTPCNMFCLDELIEHIRLIRQSEASNGLEASRIDQKSERTDRNEIEVEDEEEDDDKKESLS
jgi:hypothetical protein